MMKPIKGYEDYKINDNGIVITKKGHVMRPVINNWYLRLRLKNRKTGKMDNKTIHRLVAENFIPNPDNLPVVMHLDNDPLHDHVSNLKWGTQKDNVQQSVREGRRAKCKKQPSYFYKLYKDENNYEYAYGVKGVANLAGISSLSSIRPNAIIKSGPYEGYTITNTHLRVVQPCKFI